MTDEKLPPLPDDISALLGAARATPDPDGEVKSRVGRRLSASLGISLVGAAAAGELLGDAASSGLDLVDAAGTAAATAAPKAIGTAAGAAAVKGAAATGAATGAATAGAATAGAAGAATSAGLMAVLAKPVLIGTFVAGTMVGGTTVAVVQPELVQAPPKIVYQPAPPDPARAGDETGDDVVDDPVEPAADKPVPVAKKPKRRVAKAPPKVSGETDTGLAQERSLIEVARTALSRGNAKEALARLSEHRKRFPQGKLTEERDGLTVLALVAAGQTKEARARAERFKQRFPQSMMMLPIDAALQQTR